MVPAGGFGRVERFVGGVEQVLARISAVRCNIARMGEAGDANTHRKRSLGKRHARECRRSAVHRFANGGCDAMRGLGGEAWQGDDELVATEAAAERVLWQALRDHRADESHGVGSRVVTVRIVERFEPIEVEDHHRQRSIDATRGLQGVAETPFETAQVEETGQVIGLRHAVQLPSIVSKLRGDDANGEEERDLHDVRFRVGEREQARVADVVQHDGGSGRDYAAVRRERDASEDDRNVIEVLKRRRARSRIHPVDGEQQENDERSSEPAHV